MELYYYQYPTEHYFAHLIGVDNKRGILNNLDNGPFPYFAEFSEHQNSQSADMDTIPFSRLNNNQPLSPNFVKHEYNSLVFYCCEHHINLIFDRKKKVVKNTIRLMDDEDRAEIRKEYIRGYEAGLQKPLIEELGDEYALSPPPVRAKILEEFCRYCNDLSFFEGFAVPRVIFCIGYIQSFYYKGYRSLWELTSSLQVKGGSLPKEIPEEEIQARVAEVPGQSKLNQRNKLISLRAFENLVDTWQTIEKISKTKSLGTSEIERLEELPGQIVRSLLALANIKIHSIEETPLKQDFDVFDQSWKASLSGLLYETKKQLESIDSYLKIRLDELENFGIILFPNAFIAGESNSKGKNLKRSYDMLIERRLLPIR